ncbi:hypothetical protein [Cryobacterium sp. PAMC25264]|uniref:hypothetical protein n=1 Tax=Cryobacterium sp. PAMC25264 TaxID=2861288 RepID=UPI001C629460|nr:hypothetical protein [Cryobacterium sp. PAMC25264]QYF73730.1 hypothetical protein KY500_00060 [Cryobacterium sp. PAMC25264]
MQQLNVVTESLVELVGLSAADCTPQFVRSFVAGADYSDYPSQLASEWYIDPADRSIVHSPAGTQAASCSTVVALAARADEEEDSAAVLCDDTQVFTTGDSGTTWASPIQVSGAVNIAVTPMGYIVATVGLPDCKGVQLAVLTTEQQSVQQTGCLAVDLPTEIMQDNVAISEAGGTVWVWAGDSVQRSIDWGRTWQ